MFTRTYYVDRIRDKKIFKEKGKKVTKYLVRWEGYDYRGDTWEQSINIPTHLIQEFNRRKIYVKNGKVYVNSKEYPSPKLTQKKIITNFLFKINK